MTAPHGDRLVADYLARLNLALARMPADRREEIAGEIASHIADERAALGDETDTDVLNLLDRVGDPAEIASAAEADLPVSSAAGDRQIGAVEILALVLTPIIWPVGVILLWLSPAWSARDKVIGTVLSLGGYPVILFLGPLLFLSPALMSTCSGGSVDGRPIQETCSGIMGLPVWEHVIISVAITLGVLLVLALPVLVGIYLGVRLRRWASVRQVATS